MKKNDALVVRAARLNEVPGDAYEDWAGSAEGRDVLEGILRNPARERAPMRRVRRRIAWPAVAGLAVAIVAAVVLRDAAPPEGPRTRWAAALVAVAEEAPRLLVGAEGWKVLRAEEFAGSQGEMFFDNGPDCLDAGAPEGCYWASLNWYPAETFDAYRADRTRGASRAWEITITGETATVFRHEYPAPELTAGIDAGLRENPLTFYALWVDGDHWLEFRSDVFPTAEEFTAVAESLYAVDVDTWLSAMPPSVVKPDERGDEIDRLLTDVPVPSNLDPAELEGERVGNALDYEVSTAVVCGWIQQWIDARGSGDRAAQREAVEALAGAREWRVFRDGGMALEYVEDVADAMAEGEPVVDDSPLRVGVGYQRHIGCEEG